MAVQSACDRIREQAAAGAEGKQVESDWAASLQCQPLFAAKLRYIHAPRQNLSPNISKRGRGAQPSDRNACAGQIDPTPACVVSRLNPRICVEHVEVRLYECNTTMRLPMHSVLHQESGLEPGSVSGRWGFSVMWLPCIELGQSWQ